MKIISNKNIYFSLITLFSLTISVDAFAQQNSIFQQAYRAPKELSNLAPATKFAESFLGQDKPGPYILTYKNINFGPGSPVWVSIDNSILTSAEYSLDVAKGEVTFSKIIKRTQVVKISYSFYSDVATKNNNPTMVTTLTMKLASLGVNNLNVTPFSGAENPSFVLGFNGRSRGLSSNLFYVPGSNNVDDRAMKLGYSQGDSKNGLSADYAKSSKSFASNYGKTFGLGDAAENLNINGNLNTKDSSLAFNRKANTNLNNNFETTNQTIAANIGSGRMPKISFNNNEQQFLDAKGVFNSSNNSVVGANTNFGALNLAYKDTTSETVLGKLKTNVDQTQFGFDVKQSKGSLLKYNNLNETKTDATGTTNTQNQIASLNTGLAGGAIVFNVAQNNVEKNNVLVTNNQTNYGLGFKGNTRGFGGLSYNKSTNDTQSTNNLTSVVNEKGSLNSVFGKTTFNYNVNRINTDLNGKTRLDNEQENILFALPKSRFIPVASFVRNDDIKRNDKGILVGGANDNADFKVNLGKINLSLNQQNKDSYTPDGKMVSDNINQNAFSFSAGKSQINYFNTKANSFRGGEFASDENKIIFTSPGNKASSGFKLAFTESNTSNPSYKANSNQADVSYGLKTNRSILNFDITQGDSSYSNGIGGYTDRQSLGLSYKLNNFTSLNIGRGGNVVSDASGVRNGAIKDNYSLSTKTSSYELGVTNSVTDVAAIDKTRVFTTSDIYAFKTPIKKGAPGIEVQRIVSDSTDQTKTDTNIINDRIKLDSKVGSTNLVASVGQNNTVKNDKDYSQGNDSSFGFHTPIWGRGTSLGININNYTSTTGNTVEDKSGLSLSLAPAKGILMTAEQLENNISQGSNVARNVTGSKYTLNYSPVPSTLFQSSYLQSADGIKNSEVSEYRALLGTEKTLFKIDSLIKLRESDVANQNTDTTATTINISPVKNIKIIGNYLLNPEDPTKPGVYNPIEKRQYSIATNSGNFSLTGSYADTEHLKGTAADVLSKANGFSYYGETSIQLGMKFGSGNLVSEYKEQFYKGSTFKGTETFSLGLNQASKSTLFSLSGTYVNNNNNRPDYRGELKLTYKF